MCALTVRPCRASPSGLSRPSRVLPPWQFLFDRVEGISRATIIDLDAHQVSVWRGGAGPGPGTSPHVPSGLCVPHPPAPWGSPPYRGLPEPGLCLSHPHHARLTTPCVSSCRLVPVPLSARPGRRVLPPSSHLPFPQPPPATRQMADPETQSDSSTLMPQPLPWLPVAPLVSLRHSQ